MVGGGGAAAAAAVGMPSQATVPVRRRCEGTAMGAITLDLRPGLGVGPFTIGMPISDAFAQIEHQPNIYDVVHVKYFDEEPLNWTLLLAFRTMDSTYVLILGRRGSVS